ncbi:hypothetical protein VTL71DRAFT_5761 [Oculimacula yallundae]|uniref:Uncharacterized protein n=1 Tax=Oculimacula yallundae TaxID=86028 RepID=A0ABR4C044_9HELO
MGKASSKISRTPIQPTNVQPPAVQPIVGPCREIPQECIDAIRTLRRLPAELRILVFRHDCDNHFTSTKSVIRSPLYIALEGLTETPDTKYQILVEQYLEAWNSKEVRSNVYIVNDGKSAVELQNKTRDDRLAIQHLVFNLDETRIEEASDPDRLITGKKITISNNLKTICYRSGPKELYVLSYVYIFSILRIIVPSAFKTLEAIVVEALVEDGFENSMYGNDTWTREVEREIAYVDQLLGAKHTIIRKSSGDCFWVWHGPFGRQYFNPGVHRFEKRPRLNKNGPHGLQDSPDCYRV